MARVVESVVSAYGGDIQWETVITKDLSGAQRFLTLSKELGRPAPVPSIYINGVLAFDTTPASEELKRYLDRVISS